MTRTPQAHASRRVVGEGIRSALDELTARQGMPAKDIDYAVEGYADDMRSDAVYHVERQGAGVSGG